MEQTLNEVNLEIMNTIFLSLQTFLCLIVSVICGICLFAMMNKLKNDCTEKIKFFNFNGRMIHDYFLVSLWFLYLLMRLSFSLGFGMLFLVYFTPKEVSILFIFFYGIFGFFMFLWLIKISSEENERRKWKECEENGDN